ncbi:MAG: hypothetical protein OXU23_13645 [Candidatus Poribacteria bacterium]|nr:hypothetical protein [Candidatus Poribacteria bacterium]MDE0466352.1 hypothetical protein [Candidatus Poribacteria bacterium]
MKNLNWILASLLILISLGVSVLLIYTTTTRALTAVESTIWQVFVLTAGLVGSFIFGQQSAKEAAREIIKPHARSAFRRLVSLYESLSRASTVIELTESSESSEDIRVTIAKLDAIVTEQLNTADDALEDWRDIVPEDVEELKQKLESKIQGGIGSDSNSTNSR